MSVRYSSEGTRLALACSTNVFVPTRARTCMRPLPPATMVHLGELMEQAGVEDTPSESCQIHERTVIGRPSVDEAVKVTVSPSAISPTGGASCRVRRCGTSSTTWKPEYTKQSGYPAKPQLGPVSMELRRRIWPLLPSTMNVVSKGERDGDEPRLVVLHVQTPRSAPRMPPALPCTRILLGFQEEASERVHSRVRSAIQDPRWSRVERRSRELPRRSLQLVR